jgi:hypothetical protein
MIKDEKPIKILATDINEKSILTNFPNPKPELTSKTSNFIRCEPSEIIIQSKSYLLL